MEFSHRFFRNDGCKYFPCHEGVAEATFNCLFCFCPLYFLEDCGGNPKYTDRGVKDCSSCTRPHDPDGYDHVLKRLKVEFDK